MKVLTASILTAMAAQAAAQAEDDNVYEIVTTAIHTNVGETSLPITVLAGEELRNATRATIGETLANLPGINSASFGPAVGQPVIRGQQGRRVLVLNNSISNADVSANSADHANTIEPILADAVEVLRGPSTLLFGSGAMGGVVNVIDRRVPRRIFESPEFNLETRHNTAADESTIVGSLDFSTGNFSWHLDGVRREWNDLDVPGFAIAEGYLEENHEGEHDEDHDEEHAEHEEKMENTFGYVGNTGGESEAFTFGGSFVFDNGFIGLAVNRIENTYGLPEGAHAHEHEEEHGEEEKNVFIDMARIRYDLTGEWRNLTPLIEHVDYRLTYTEYEHNELEGIGEIGTTFSNEGWQQRLQMTHTETAGWHGVFGIQTADEEFGAVGEESYIPVVDVSSMGLFLVEDYHMEDLTLEFGARFNKDEYGPTNIPAPGRDFDTFSLSVSALWDISPLASFGANWSRSERAPSVEELYSNFGLADIEGCVIHFATSACEIGNSNFSEEESNNFDLQVNLTLENMTLSIAVFNNDFDNYIAQIATGEEIDEFAVREYRQIDASFSGFEVDATF
jgi:iron complex outermembrane receptor protein